MGELLPCVFNSVEHQEADPSEVGAIIGKGTIVDRRASTHMQCYEHWISCDGNLHDCRTMLREYLDTLAM